MDIQVTKKQQAFMEAREDEVLYGGAAGGGKSYVQLIDALVYGITYPGMKQLVLRRSFPELERSLIRVMLEIYPQQIYSYNSSKHTLRFNNGSIIDFGFCDNESDVYKYQSAEYDVIRIDEATHFTQMMYEYLRTRIRGANTFPTQMKCSTNPGNVGHQYFKSRFIDCMPPMTTYEVKNPRTGKVQTRLFIPSRVTDNKFLMEADPDYVARLEDLPTDQRKALLEGSWDLYEGQFFPEFDRDIHVIKTLPERTRDWRIYFTCDYGLDMFAGLFIACDEKDNAYVMGEIYQPNVIISEAAKLIGQKRRQLGIVKCDEYLGPSDMWIRRQETGKSVADIFRTSGILLHKTSRNRIAGWAATKEWLHPYRDEQGILTSRLKIHESCVNLIRTLPALQYDKNRPSDAAVQPHEITHAPDALRGFCVYRSRANREEPPVPPEVQSAEKELDTFNSNGMFDIYGGRKRRDVITDSYDSSDSSSYNPMYL